MNLVTQMVEMKIHGNAAVESHRPPEGQGPQERFLAFSLAHKGDHQVSAE